MAEGGYIKFFASLITKTILGNWKMKAQMKFQKILSLVTIIVAALALIAALSFFSGNLSDIMMYRMEGLSETYMGRLDLDGDGEYDLVFSLANPVVTADYLTDAHNWIESAQSTISTIITLCIIFFVVIAFAYILGMSSRRNYYITNHIMSAVIIAYSAFLAVFGIVSMISLMTSFYTVPLDFPGDDKFLFLKITLNLPEVSSSPLMFILCIVAFVLVLGIALAWLYNAVWKIKLMKGEKALLSDSMKEVA